MVTVAAQLLPPKLYWQDGTCSDVVPGSEPQIMCCTTGSACRLRILHQSVKDWPAQLDVHLEDLNLGALDRVALINLRRTDVLPDKSGLYVVLDEENKELAKSDMSPQVFGFSVIYGTSLHYPLGTTSYLLSSLLLNPERSDIRGPMGIISRFENSRVSWATNHSAALRSGHRFFSLLPSYLWPRMPTTEAKELLELQETLREQLAPFLRDIGVANICLDAAGPSPIHTAAHLKKEAEEFLLTLLEANVQLSSSQIHGRIMFFVYLMRMLTLLSSSHLKKRWPQVAAPVFDAEAKVLEYQKRLG